MPGLKELGKRYEVNSINPYTFPEVGWLVTEHKFFDRYRIASKAHYDPYTGLPWEKLDPASLSEEERTALRYYWSRHAAFEYSLILPILKSLEEAITKGYPTEVKQLLMAHLRDEWHHTEMSAEYARRLGGLLLMPSLLKRYEQWNLERLQNLGKRLHPTFIRLSFSEMVAGQSWYAPFRQVKDPIASGIFSYIYVDEQRHSRSNWEWATKGVTGSMLGRVTEDDKREAEKLLSNIADPNAPIYGWLGFGYLDLSKEEQEFHIESLKIAKELGHTLLDAEGFLSAYTREAKNLSKIVEEAGLSAKVA